MLKVQSRCILSKRQDWTEKVSALERAQAISGAVNFMVAPSKKEDCDAFLKEALMCHQALQLCSSVVEESLRFEAAFYESVRVLITRLRNSGSGKKLSLKEINDRIGALLEQSIKNEGVINLFSDVETGFSLFDPKFLDEIAKMKHKNLAVEMLKKLLMEQIRIYQRTNLVKSVKFSELMAELINKYINGLISNEEVIQELLKLAKGIKKAKKVGAALGLTGKEMAFYDALTKPEAILDFYTNDQLLSITREPTETLRKNRTIDWQKRDSAKAGMKMLVKRLLKKYHYPPDDQPEALETIIHQSELWVDGLEGDN